MPTYNHAAFVGDAIESVLAQTFGAWELIVVDDGSTDGTLEIVRRYRDPRIQVIAREHSGLSGLGATYRAALGSSTAPYVAILEGDDTWPPDKLARQVVDFDDPEVVFSYGAGWLIDEFGCRYGHVEPSFPEAIRTNRPTGAIIPDLLLNNPIPSPTVVLRRSALEAIGGFWQPDGVPYVDHPTWLLLAGRGPFAYHSSIVGSWRRHPAQWTTSVVAAGSEAPEVAYVGLAAVRLSGLMSGTPPLPTSNAAFARHSERAMLNRWRMALLSAGRSEVLRSFGSLMRSRRPRLMALAIVGLTARAAGSDLEWLQIRRNRVAWPSRRHLRRHHKTAVAASPWVSGGDGVRPR
jgi:hypothetical protein